LRGRSKVVAFDPYEIYIYVPDGYNLKNSSPTQATKEGQVAKLAIAPEKTGTIEWEVVFNR
jgi:hypothetical protein